MQNDLGESSSAYHFLYEVLEGSFDYYGFIDQYTRCSAILIRYPCI
jgi:hypothetical protein